MSLLLLSLLLLHLSSSSAHLDPPESLSRMVFVLMTQEHEEKISLETERALKEALSGAGLLEPEFNIVVTGREAPLHGSWTFFPLFPFLQEEFKGDYDWFIFLNENARVNPSTLAGVLSPHSPDEPLFLGHALKDKDHTVIHHYDPPFLSFPAFGSGFALSFKLVEELSLRITSHGLNVGKFPSTFSIDPLYELANVIHHSHLDEQGEDSDEDDPLSLGPLLSHTPAFCLDEGPSCATYAVPTPVCPLGDILQRTLFAVKTTEAFHVSRLSIIQSTWGRAAPHIIYASEKEDPSIPTTALPGIINTQNGHCSKTTSIIRHFNGNTTTYDWLFIADDDTLLSVQKVGEVLACIDPSIKPLALGQRYGFRVSSGEYGYDYITGGGGMIFNRLATEKMFSSPEYCTCPKPDYPDDMHLGSCMSNIGSPVLHHPGFHQARPEDYDETLIRHQRPVSFHKFINTDPLAIYEKWFAGADRQLPGAPEPKGRSLPPHEEL